jgi:hypothetical protein
VVSPYRASAREPGPPVRFAWLRLFLVSAMSCFGKARLYLGCLFKVNDGWFGRLILSDSVLLIYASSLGIALIVILALSP